MEKSNYYKGRFIKSIILFLSGIDIEERTRRMEVVEMRYIFFYLCEKYAHLKPENTAKLLSHKYDRTTVLHGLKSIHLWIESQQLQYHAKVLKEIESTIENVLSSNSGDTVMEAYASFKSDYSNNVLHALIEMVARYEAEIESLKHEITQLKKHIIYAD